MRRLVACSVLVLFASAYSVSCQQVAPVSATASSDKPRIFVTDSNSWSTQGSAGGSNGAFGGSSSGGARPQTAEIIKTFGQRCPQVLVNNRANVSDYIVELDHEGGKNVFSHKDKIAVFVQKTGDSIFSKSTMSVGGSVQDACAALIAHWAAHASELKAAVAASTAVQASVVPVALVVQTSAITVEASSPNCDIEVDGSFVGSTPSTMNLTPGKHDILVKKAGYKDWTRSMNVASGAIRVSADMIAVQ